jgi:hypothetical protein
MEFESGTARVSSDRRATLPPAPGKWRNGIGSVLGMKRSATVLIFDRGGGNISREPLS